MSPSGTLRAVSVVALLPPLLAGCGYTSGFIRDSRSANVVEYRFDVAGERFVRQVSGSADVGYLFCFIPLERGAYKRAMGALYAEAHLAPNQVVMNLREDHTTVSYVGFYCSSTLTVSGDVFEFAPKGEDASRAENPPQPPSSLLHGVVDEDASFSTAGCLQERLAPADIQSVVQVHRQEMVDCAREQHRLVPELNGTLVVQWVVRKDGGTKQVQILPETLRSSFIGNCIAASIKNWQFPCHKAEQPPVEFPFTF
jgi:hypothetical protein